jgi:fluoroquinolone transport system permease protein
MKKVIALSLNEFRNIYRDNFLVLISLLPVFIGLAFRFGVPILRKLLLSYFDLSEYYPFMMSMLIILTPSMFGWLTGFTLLDDRDEDILTYMSVTPIGKPGYLTFKIASPAVFSFFWTFLILIIAGLTPVDFLKLIPIAFMASLQAPIFALFLASFARNKVEGLAVAKLGGMVFLAPFAAYFLKSGWSYFAGLIWPYWITKAYLATGWLYWISIIAGISVHLVYLKLLLIRFSRRMVK